MSTQAINPSQSCKCPLCGQWKSSKDILHGHLLSQHKINPPFHVKGNGERAHLVLERPKQRRGGCG